MTTVPRGRRALWAPLVGFWGRDLDVIESMYIDSPTISPTRNSTRLVVLFHTGNTGAILRNTGTHTHTAG